MCKVMSSGERKVERSIFHLLDGNHCPLSKGAGSKSIGTSYGDLVTWTPVRLSWILGSYILCLKAASGSAISFQITPSRDGFEQNLNCLI